MLRWLAILLAVALPFAVYGLWLTLERGRRRAAKTGEGGWRSWPWSWLLLASLGLLIAYLLSLRIFGWDPDGLITGPSLIQRDGRG